MSRARAIAIWMGFGAVLLVPITIASQSPLLAWRSPIYIAGGFAGVLALALTCLQPVLAQGFLPGLSSRNGRRLHIVTGAALVVAVIVHVGGLWFTSPPDVVDALLLRSPTPFAVWGVMAMWAVFVAAMLVMFRKRLRLSPQRWRAAHLVCVSIVVVGGIAHALLIEGTMGTWSKIMLCLVLAFVFVGALFGRIAARAGNGRKGRL